MAATIGSEQDIDDEAPPPGPSPREVRERWAAEGDVEALLDLIRQTSWSMISVGEQLQNLATACRVAAKADPERFARLMFAEMVGINAFLTLRTQLYITNRVVGRGPRPCTPSLADISPDVVDRLLPRLLEMQRGMAEILHAQASTARMWALARAKDSQAGRVSEKDRRPRSSGGKSRGRRRGVDSDVAAREVVVPIEARGRRRG